MPDMFDDLVAYAQNPLTSIPNIQFPVLPTLPSLPLPDLSNISDLVNTVKMPAGINVKLPNLAPSIFSTGPKETAATPDIYAMVTGTSGRSPITSIQGLNLMPDTSLFDKLDGSSTLDFLDKAKQGIKFNPDALKDRITGLTGDLKASFNGMSDKLKQGSMLDTFKDKAKFALATVKDAKSLVKVAKTGDIKALGSFVNKYTGTAVFSGKDKGALGGLLSSTVKLASDSGLSGIFSAVSSTVADNGVIGKITRATLPYVVKNSDSRLLKELANGNAGKLIDTFSPGFSKDFSKAFKYSGTNAKTLTSFEDILGSFQKVNAGWDVLARGPVGNTATDLKVLSASSKDFQSLLLTGVSYWNKRQRENPAVVPPVPPKPMFMLSGMFPEISVSGAFRRDFPKVVMLSLYDTRLPRPAGKVAGTRSPKKVNTIDIRLAGGVLGALFS